MLHEQEGTLVCQPCRVVLAARACGGAAAQDRDYHALDLQICISMHNGMISLDLCSCSSSHACSGTSFSGKPTLTPALTGKM